MELKTIAQSTGSWLHDAIYRILWGLGALVIGICIFGALVWLFILLAGFIGNHGPTFFTLALTCFILGMAYNLGADAKDMLLRRGVYNNNEEVEEDEYS